MFSSSTATAAGVACLAALSSQVCAYPSFWGGDVTKAVPGGAFGNMGIANYEAASSDACKITHDIPKAGFTIGIVYTFTISTSENELGMVWSIGGGQMEKGNTGSKKHSSEKVLWTGRGADAVSAYAICGAGGAFRGVHVAASVTVKKKAATMTTAMNAAATTATTTTAAASVTATDDVTPAIHVCDLNADALHDSGSKLDLTKVMGLLGDANKFCAENPKLSRLICILAAEPKCAQAISVNPIVQGLFTGKTTTVGGASGTDGKQLCDCFANALLLDEFCDALGVEDCRLGSGGGAASVRELWSTCLADHPADYKVTAADVTTPCFAATGVFSFALGPLCAPCWHVLNLLRRVVGAGWVCG